ncbi:DUF4232 domain-containing protein [Streptomyces sp. A0642]|nr:DUF4232 domain-containing protein [Streptomyces sp. A0642]
MPAVRGGRQRRRPDGHRLGGEEPVEEERLALRRHGHRREQHARRRDRGQRRNRRRQRHRPPGLQAADLTTAVELQDASGETPRHFLLTVTNGSKSPCVLNDAPQVRLGAGDDAPVVEPLGEPDTEPVVVEGGGKGYAGLYVFGNDEGGEAEYDQADRFTATLVAGEGTELSGTLVFHLPRGLRSVSYDDAARVNGWAGTEGLAMRPVSQL